MLSVKDVRLIRVHIKLNARPFGSSLLPFIITGLRLKMESLDAEMDGIFGTVQVQQLLQNPQNQGVRAREGGAEARTPKAARREGGKGKGGKFSQGSEESLVHMLSRLVLRQEASIQALRQSTGWVLFVAPGPQSPLQLLFRVAADWRQQMAERTHHAPLRVVLIFQLFQLLQTRLTQSTTIGTGAEGGQGEGLARGQWVGIPEVAAGDKNTRGRRHSSPSHRRGTAHCADSSTASYPGGGSHLEVSRDTEAARDTYSCEHVPAGCGTEKPERLEPLASAGDGKGSLGTSDLRPPDQTRGSEAVQACHRRRAQALAAILSCVLNNPSNLCYINSWVLAYLWTCAHLSDSTGLLLGRCPQAWRDVMHAASPVNISALPSWRRLLHGWKGLHRQHDAFEFACHVNAMDRPLIHTGEWQARLRNDVGYRIWDRGAKYYPIVMRFPEHLDEPLSLQSVILHWHNQHVPFALSDSPPAVCLLLARYQTRIGDNGRAEITKDERSVLLNRHLQLPCFIPDSTDCVWQPFQLTAAVIHHGPDTSSGHYQAVLLHAETTWERRPSSCKAN